MQSSQQQVPNRKIAAKKIAIRKAPGLDSVPGLAIKTAALNVSYIFEETFNACLSEGIFPAVEDTEVGTPS